MGGVKEKDPNGRTRRIVCAFDERTFLKIKQRAIMRHQSVAAEIRELIDAALETDATGSSVSLSEKGGS